LNLVGFADIVQHADVRMVQGGDRAGFSLEARLEIAIGRDMFRQDLDGDDAIEPHILRAVDLAHSARADGSENFIRPETTSNAQRHRRLRIGLGVSILTLALGPHPQRELTPMRRRRLCMAASAAWPQALMPPAPSGAWIS
jgi:hypothetical protein